MTESVVGQFDYIAHGGIENVMWSMIALCVVLLVSHELLHCIAGVYLFLPKGSQHPIVVCRGVSLGHGPVR